MRDVAAATDQDVMLRTVPKTATQYAMLDFFVRMLVLHFPSII